jgi:hypothetical protein
MRREGSRPLLGQGGKCDTTVFGAFALAHFHV